MPAPSTLIAIGIDPGATGAIALLIGGCATVFDTPATVDTKKGKVRRRVDEGETLALIGRIASVGCDVAAVEAVGGSAGQSAPAAYTFGYATAIPVMALRAHGIVPMRPAPIVWKGILGLKGDDDGTRARELAASLYPLAAGELRRKCDHNRADAILLAHYARVTLARTT